MIKAIKNNYQLYSDLLNRVITKGIENMQKVTSFDDPRVSSMFYKVKMLNKQLKYYDKQGLELPGFIQQEITELRDQLEKLVTSGGSDK